MRLLNFSKTLLCAWLVGAQVSLFAAKENGQRKTLTSRPIASVNLYKSEALTTQRFSEEVQKAETLMQTKLDAEMRLALREKMIESMILLQAAEKEKIKCSDNELLTLLRQQTGQTNASLNDIKTLFEGSQAAQFQTWDALLTRLREEIIVRNYYLKMVPRDSIKHPTDAEIKQAFQDHKEAFRLPVTARFSHIFFSFETEGGKTAARRDAEKALASINNGKTTFEEAVVQFSQDRDSAGHLGDRGYIADTPSSRQALGDEFITKVMSMRAGQISGIVQSTSGYHIIKITEKHDGKQLTLNDPNPTDPRSTVYQLVEMQLMEQEYAKKVDIFVKNLKSQAKININEDVWGQWGKPEASK